MLYDKWASAQQGFLARMPRSTGWVALATAFVAVVTLPAAVTTPPRSGSFCSEECLSYPYTDPASDIARFVPRDYLWMYPATLLALLFGVLVLHLHRSTPPEARIWSSAAVASAGIATVVLVVDYGIQLTVVQPSLVHGETAGLTLLTQYNPRGIFIGLEDIGYLAMGLAFLLLGIALRGSSLAERAVRWLLVGGGVLVVVLLVVLALVHGSELGYRFEVWAILVDWLVLVAVAIVIARSTAVRR